MPIPLRLAIAIALAMFVQEPAQTGAGSIAGRVVDGRSGLPLGGIPVQLQDVPRGATVFPLTNSGRLIVTGTGRTLGPVITDGDGRFRFGALPDGFYELHAYAFHNISRFGQTDETDVARVIEIRAGQSVTGVNVRAWHSPVLSGRVIDESGRAVIGVEVAAIPPAEVHQFLATATDDRGMFAVGVSPGDYYVAVRPPTSIARADALLAASIGRQQMVYPITFFPGALSIDQAVRISVAAEDRQTGIDFQLKPIRAYRIVGRNPAVPTSRPWINLISDDLAGGSGASTLTQADLRIGQFTMNGVPPGSYRLRAVLTPEMPFSTHGTTPLQKLPPEPTLWADVPVTVSDRDVEIQVDLRPGFRITGKVSFEGGQPPSLDQLSRWPIVIQRAIDNDADLRGLYLSASAFATIQVPPGRYFIRPAESQGWFVKSITASGRNVVGSPIEVGSADRNDVEITFSNRPTKIRGSVQPPIATGMSRTWVTVFSADRSEWIDLGEYARRLALIQVGVDGTYETLLPPGTYFVVATDRPVRVPGDFSRLSLLAETVVLTDGTTISQNLKTQKAGK